MPSPFPGMDPYLEQHWSEVHPRLIVDSANQMQRQLRGSGLLARIEERLLVEGPLEDSRRVRGDVVVTEHDPDFASYSWGDGGVAVATEPLLVLAPEPEITAQRYITITDSSGARVITIIEFLSPSNKFPGDGREQYLRKQGEALDAGVNLVEIDLTRFGDRVLAYAYHLLPVEYQTTCITRAHPKKRHEIYRMALNERLPTIRIPLRVDDKDITLNLQAAISRAYEEGAFEVLDYKKPCLPPLSGRDSEMAGSFLKPA